MKLSSLEFLPLNPELQMRSLLGGLTILVLTACQPSAPKTIADTNAAADSAAHLAHEAYTTAINSNNLDSLTEMFTEDVVFLAAHSPPIVGKPAVRQWAKDYLDAFTTHWDKTAQEFKVAGDWAFERYSYKSTDTPKTGGAPIEDTGWGLLIYHHDTDGKWRVARDAFSTEAALPTK
jgi:ketosteroid isomerase-like protein